MKVKASLPYFFSAHALPAQENEAHVQSGNHLRLSHNPLLGLPKTPFVVWRAVLDNTKALQRRNQVSWFDSNGEQLTTPFDVHPNNPVTAYLSLAAGEVCMWAEVFAKPAQSALDILASDRLSIPTRPSFNATRRINHLRPFVRPRSTRALSLARNTVLSERFLVKKSLTVEAFVPSHQGPVAIAKCKHPRYAFSAPGIIELKVTGTGTVTNLEWFERNDTLDANFKPWQLLSLPHTGGSRYISMDNARAHAQQRVSHGAPKRKPLQETLNTPSPADAPPASSDEELKRVTSFAHTLDIDLEALINDLSMPETAHISMQNVVDENLSTNEQRKLGTIESNRLGVILQSCLDPGIANWLGYKTYDSDFTDKTSQLVVYYVTGYWDIETLRKPRDKFSTSDKILAKFLGQEGTLNNDDSGSSNDVRSSQSFSPLEVHQQLQAISKKMGPSFKLSPNGLNLDPKARLTSFSCIAIADRGSDLSDLEPVKIDSHEHVRWQPATPPQTRREVRLGITKTGIGATLAGNKLTINTDTRQALNATNQGKYHLPLALALPGEHERKSQSPKPGDGNLYDREAIDSDIRYAVAQQDYFGRWSSWAKVVNSPGPRPKPPRPVYQAVYIMPKDLELSTRGEISIKVHVPTPESMPLASHLLHKFELRLSDLATGQTQSVVEVLDNPTNPAQTLEFLVDGPILQATEQRKWRLLANWIDSQGQESIDSEAIVLTMTDPRPPQQLVSVDSLNYSARPDITGKAWIHFEWPTQASQSSFAVYYSDENRLLSYLESNEIQHGDLLDSLKLATSVAAKASLLRANSQVFPSHLFERLENVAFKISQSKYGFKHSVSGSLKVLSFYKVVAQSSSGSRPEFELVPMLSYGVPNTAPPAKPTVSVTPVLPNENGGEYLANITLKLIAGQTQGARYRIRRSSQGAENALRMPILPMNERDTLPVPDVDGVQIASLEDNGELVIESQARLRPWIRYYWVGEVQGLPESGSAVEGLWSEASDAFSTILVPPKEPSAPIGLIAEGKPSSSGFKKVKLKFSYEHAFYSSERGGYVARIYMKRPGQAQQLVREEVVNGSGPFAFRDLSSPQESLPADTTFRVFIVDPAGRVGLPADVTSIVVKQGI
ncbi:hypothetical protein DBZ36_05225 [Alginatibacterium sediminis]|uniref:Uncharacterized protein n=1 Tax=Alginatibacterium sediminis TaxID=2164068 RepID=A0A420EGL9_9ALTE|nr:hypothetical protein [Alginatibacterium sediminis]RKF19861.1 hypothetical protein DBZ36_05225 [Alginatibacterium sediminis]